MMANVVMVRLPRAHPLSTRWSQRAVTGRTRRETRDLKGSAACSPTACSILDAHDRTLYLLRHSHAPACHYCGFTLPKLLAGSATAPSSICGPTPMPSRASAGSAGPTSTRWSPLPDLPW